MGLTHLLKGHSKDLGGGMLVKRMLPAAVQRSVGPFVFLIILARSRCFRRTTTMCARIRTLAWPR
jgi:hypothetical protein